MPYYEQIRKTLNSQDLVDIFNLFATGQDTTQIANDHQNSLLDDNYKKSAKCDLIERCLVRFSKLDLHPDILRLQKEIQDLKQAHHQEIKDLKKSHAIVDTCYEAQKNMISVQMQQIQELERSNNNKNSIIYDLEQQCGYLDHQCAQMSHSRSSDILQGAEDMLSPGTRWLAKFFLSQEITKRVADKFRS